MLLQDLFDFGRESNTWQVLLELDSTWWSIRLVRVRQWNDGNGNNTFVIHCDDDDNNHNHNNNNNIDYCHRYYYNYYYYFYYYYYYYYFYLFYFFFFVSSLFHGHLTNRNFQIIIEVSVLTADLLLYESNKCIIVGTWGSWVQKIQSVHCENDIWWTLK